MKVQERAAGRAAASAQTGVGERLPTPPRERKPALAALAVLLILVGALGATVLVLRAGDRVSVVKTTKEIPAGGTINRGNATSVMVAEDESIHYIPWEQLDAAKSLKAKAVIPGGAVVVGEMFGSAVAVAEGKALVGLALKEGQYPADLKPGDTVAVYRVGKDAAGGNASPGASGASGGGNALLTDNAEISKAGGTSKSAGAEGVDTGDKTVTVLVDEGDAQALAQASSAGEAAVVLVPGRSGN